MSTDDIIYLTLLLSTIFVGHYFRTLEKNKEWFGTIVGHFILFFVSGFHAFHPILCLLFTIALLKFCSKSHIHIISFVGLFSYLLFFRLCHLLGLPMPPAHANAIQMILTLKLVGICFEVHDTWRKQQKLKTSESKEEKALLRLELKYEGVNPSLLDVFHYAFSYIGILTGPYYKFRTYTDMINFRHKAGSPDCIAFTLHRLHVVPFYCLMFLISNHFFPLSFAESEEIFKDYSFLYRVFYMTPVFFTFRMRIYTGFVLSECACIMAGLGAYPVEAKSRPGRGPSDYQALENRGDKPTPSTGFNFETIHNIDEWGSDFSPTVRGGMKCWNMTVQYWLATNVYKRLKMAKAIKEAMTMFASAFWHGVYSGYYLSMLTVPFILAVEDFYDRLIRRKLSPKGQSIYDWVCWILKMQQFAYMGMGFLLLKVDTTLHYWRSVGFIYHGLIVILHALAQYVSLIRWKVDKKLEKSRNSSIVGDCRVKFVRHNAEHKASTGDVVGVGDIVDISNVFSKAGNECEGHSKKTQ